MKLKIGSPIIPQKEEEEVELYLEKDGDTILLKARTPEVNKIGFYWNILQFRESDGKLVMERIGNIEDSLISTDVAGAIWMV